MAAVLPKFSLQISFIFIAFLIWLIVHMCFKNGVKYQTDSLVDLASETVCFVVISKVLCHVLKKEAKRVLDIFRPFISWNKREWYTKQMTERGTSSTVLLHQSLKRSSRSGIKNAWSHSRLVLSRSILHWTMWITHSLVESSSTKEKNIHRN